MACFPICLLLLPLFLFAFMFYFLVLSGFVLFFLSFFSFSHPVYVSVMSVCLLFSYLSVSLARLPFFFCLVSLLSCFVLSVSSLSSHPSSTLCLFCLRVCLSVYLSVCLVCVLRICLSTFPV